MSELKEHLEQLAGPDEVERAYAAEDIGYLNDPDAVAPLLKRLAMEPAPAVREAIFQALGRIDADTAIEGAIELLASDDPQMRNHAVEILRRKGPAAIPFLNLLMQSGDKDLRKLTLDVLSGIQTTGAEAIYAAALSDDDPNVVITAVENIGRTRDLQFRERIEGLLLTASHPMLVGACLEALVGIGNQLSLATVRRRFPVLATLPDFFLVSCLKALGGLGSDGEFAEIASLLPIRGAQLRPAILAALIAIHQRHPARPHHEDLLPSLRAVVDDRAVPLCSYQAVRALGFVSARDDVYSFLLACLTSPERLVRLGAIESLRETPRPELEKVLAARALQETDEEVAQALNC